jgi:hypothetical protein
MKMPGKTIIPTGQINISHRAENLSAVKTKKKTVI